MPCEPESHPRTLYAMRDSGFLEQIARGLYRLADMPALGNPDLVSVALKVQGGVICLISALAFHEVTTQIPHEVYVALKRGVRTPRLGYPPLRIFRFSGKAFTEGVEAHEIDGVSVRIYSPEKTLADCFKYRNKIGMDTALEALQAAEEDKGGRPARSRPHLSRREGDASIHRGNSMTKSSIKNTSASVRQRLPNKARETSRPYNELLQYYAMERFLYRLSQSQHSHKFILKGALMFVAWRAPVSRPTMDIDLLGRISNRIDRLFGILRCLNCLQNQPNRAYPSTSRWIRWNRCSGFNIP
jgi:predicted transcriptional regulator of viral defense system